MALIVPLCSPCHVSIRPPSKAGEGMEIETAWLRPGLPRGSGLQKLKHLHESKRYVWQITMLKVKHVGCIMLL